jgi:hypothetical protein
MTGTALSGGFSRVSDRRLQPMAAHASIWCRRGYGQALSLFMTSRGSRVVLITGVLLVLIGAVGAVGSWRAYSLDTGIEESGLRAVGYIADKSMSFASDGDSDFNVSYWFILPSGERIEATRAVSKARWSEFRKDGTLVVAYSASNPRRNFPLGAGVTSLGVTVFLSMLGVVFAGFGSLLVWGALRRTRSEA